MYMFLAYICAEQNWTLHEYPSSKVCSLFLDCEPTVTDLHHVHVIVSAKADVAQILSVILNLLDINDGRATHNCYKPLTERSSS